MDGLGTWLDLGDLREGCLVLSGLSEVEMERAAAPEEICDIGLRWVPLEDVLEVPQLGGFVGVEVE